MMMIKKNASNKDKTYKKNEKVDPMWMIILNNNNYNNNK